MALFEDIAEEFKSASPGGKALMLVAIIIVAGLGYYVYRQKQANGTNNTSGTLVPLDLSSLGSGGGGSTGGGTTTPPTDHPPIIVDPGPPPVRVPGPPPIIVDPGPPPVRVPGPPPVPIPPPNNPSPPPQQKGQWVTVTKWPSQYGTLWGIAQAIYGNGSLWTRIASYNHISNPKSIQPGQRLFVPQ